MTYTLSTRQAAAASPKKESLGTVLNNLQLRMHAGIAVLGAAIADQQLEDAILTKMHKLSRKLHDELFTGYGPLSSLSSKIALAYALDLIDRTTYKRLTVARRIRNKFAHADEFLDLSSPPISQLLKKFPSDSERKLTNEYLYLWHLQQVEAHLVITAGPRIKKSTAAGSPAAARG